APAPSTAAAIKRRSPTTPSSGMGLGLCAELKRLWTRLVMKTVLPERLRPVTASQTVAPPASSPRLSPSDGWAETGGSQLKFTMHGISHPLGRHGCPAQRVHARADGTAGGGLKIGLSQVERWTAAHGRGWPRKVRA